MKVCRSCSESKPFSDFRISKKLDNGDIRYKLDCKDCIKSDWAYCLMSTISSRNSRHNTKRDKSFNMKYIKELFKKQKGKCYWLGIELDATNKCRIRKPSIDRLDNSKGYEIGNVVLTTVFANTGRRDATVNEMRKFVDNYL